MGASNAWWDELVDRWVRLKSQRLDDRILLPRKLMHTSLIVLIWPILHLQRPVLVVILLASCGIVAVTQRRVAYASLGLLTLLAFARILAVGGGWAIFTAGDGLSAIVGRAIGGPALPWNAHKTWAGSAAFLVAAGIAAFFLLRVDASALGWGRSLAAALSTALAGTLVESLDVRLDDNYSVIVVAGVILQAWLVL